MSVEQKQKCLEVLMAEGVFDADMLKREVDWFFGGLGLHEFYFAGQTSQSIAQHIQSLLSSRILCKSSNKAFDINVHQESSDSAFYMAKSNVHDQNTRMVSHGLTEVESLERKLEREYLSSSTECVGDGVRLGYQFLEDVPDVNPNRQFRLQCYRSSGVLHKPDVPHHVRMYFLQKPDFVCPIPSEEEKGQLEKVADKRFLERAGDNLKSVYQSCITTALQQMTPTFHTEIWEEPDGSKMARLVIAHRVHATHSYFSGIADVYRTHGLFSSRKYVEFFSNGIVIFGFYLQELNEPSKRKYPFEDKIRRCVADASLHFVLPRTSLTPMLRENLLGPHEVAYAYAAWKFTFHFLHRLPDAYTMIAQSLREKDPLAFARLDQLRQKMKFNTYTEAQILEALLPNGELIKCLYADFQRRHSPFNSDSNKGVKDVTSTIKKLANSEQIQQIFDTFLTFNQHILKTNFYRKDKSALSFRLDGDFLSKAEFPDVPFAIIFVIGSEFRGFHIRFLDIARGGIRMIRSSHAQTYLKNVTSLFEECYSLAHTQHRKNKDIPEGGSKGVILLNQFHQNKAEVAFKKYIDAVLDIMIPEAASIGVMEEEILFLGPDEGTADNMDWASSYARKRGYSYWKGFTTGKSAEMGGIPHDTYGMTTHSVRQYTVGIQQKLGLKQMTKVQTGGPDGDLGSNEIIMSEGVEQTIAVVDGSGVLYDPKGINAKELSALAKKRVMVEKFPASSLSSAGYNVNVNETDVKLPNGTLIENGTFFRNGFHLEKSLHADFFVPCGGRPASVNLSNVQSFLFQEDGKTLRFKYIVEGANLFFTQDARLELEKHGVILFKDASANKGGVTSSSLEVLAALSLTDEEFKENMSCKANKIPAFYAEYVKEVQQSIDSNAQKEFECMWNEHQRTKTPLCVLSDQLSRKIVDLTIKIQSSKLWENLQLRQKLMEKALPKVLVKLVGLDTVVKRLPETYTKALFASQLASNFIYSSGLEAPEFAFYEFVQQNIH